MKFVLLILILFNSQTYGQSTPPNPYDKRDNFEQFRYEDSLEGLYSDDALLRVYTDTIPGISTDEVSIWRTLKLVTYYYDDLGRLKNVYYSSRSDGYYYFYYEEDNIRKVRFYKNQFTNKVFYFSSQHNQYTIPEIVRKIQHEPEQQELYESLKKAKEFFERFQKRL